MTGSTIDTFDGFEGSTWERRARDLDEASIAARRTTVRGGVVCGRRAPVLRLAAVTDERQARQAQRSRPTADPSRRQAARGSAARPAHRPLRLTRRGRRVLVLLPITAVLAGLLVAAAGQLADASSVPGVHLPTITVQSGDTLWSIAVRLAPSDDPRDVIAEIERVNGLDGADVRAGQSIAVPDEYAHSHGVPMTGAGHRP